jgi:hypothetical protein
MVTDGMTRCSAFVHDQPPERQPHHGRGDLDLDVERLAAFEKAVKKEA